MIDQVFKHFSDARVIHGALPADFMQCFKDGFGEIIIIGHALQSTDSNNSILGLGYFKEETQGQYAIKAFLPHVFESVRDQMRTMKSQGQKIALKQIRWMSCLPNQVIGHYSALRELIEENSIHLDIAPEQVISSFLAGEQVTTLDQVWLSESAQYNNDDPTHPSYFFSYMDLDTVGVFRYGSGFALQGRYKIELTGFALGLGSKWTTVFIQYSSLSGMDIGETRNIVSAELDASAALWINFQINLLPVLTAQLPSEINSWGISVGLASDIAIKRIY